MMKNSFLVFMLIMAFFSVKAQKCPEFYHQTGVAYEFDKVNLHKPRTECSKGFGLCVQGHWAVICSQDIPGTKIGDGKVTFWYELKDNQLELHIPIDLRKEPEYLEEDMDVFSIDSDCISLYDSEDNLIGKLKGGDYSTTQTDQDFVVLIDIE